MEDIRVVVEYLVDDDQKLILHLIRGENYVIKSLVCVCVCYGEF